MGKKKKQKKLCNNCIQYQTSDKPNKLANVGFRVLYTLIAWWWLGYGLSEGNTFFVSLGLFIIPLTIEYISFKPEEKWRNNLRIFQLILCFMGIFIAMLGVFNGIEIVEKANNLIIKATDKHILMKDWNYCMNLRVLYMMILVFVASTTIDWIASPRNVETGYKKASCSVS